ncbi:MAG: hypothetical protein ACOX8E_03620 [Ruminococcus sp.]
MGRFLKWIVNIILLCAIVVAAALLIPPLAGITTVMVDQVDMDTNLEAGSVTYARDVDFAEIEAGDNILISENGGEYVYRVRNLDTSDGTCSLEDTRTPGAGEVSKTLQGEVAKVILTVPFIGYIPMAMRSTEGLIVIGLAVVFVIILFVLAELWRPDREEEEETDEEEEMEVPQERPVHMNTPSQIMEEASSEIASVVSSVVAEESQQQNPESRRAEQEEEEQYSQPETVQMPEEDSELDEIDRKLRDGSETVAEEEILRDDMEQDNEEDAVILSLEEEMRSEEVRAEEKEPEEEAAPASVPVEEEETESPDEETQTGDAFEVPEEAAEPEEISEPEEAGNAGIPESELTEEENEPEPAAGEEKRLAMPVYTAEELIAKAKEKGEDPKVIKDDKSGVTILDYSDLL